MAASRRKELKKPDEFVAQGQAALDWLSEHARWILLAVAVLIVAFTSTYIWREFREAQLRSDYATLDKGLRLVAADVGPATVRSLEELEALEAGDGEVRFESEEEKWKAVREKMTEIRPELSRRTPEMVAVLYQGEAATELGDHKAAVEAFSQLTGMAKDPFFAQLAWTNLAVAQINAGEYEQALESLSKAKGLREEPGALGSTIAITEAFAQRRLGNNEAAVAALAELEKAYPVESDQLGVSVQKAALEQGFEPGFGVELVKPSADDKPAAAEGETEAAEQGRQGE